MLQFETLLLKQLQRQQNRAEFCDVVLQTQGVSVPVHSCVLSAFSPWLCGALASMPAPLVGQRRVIKLQAVEACTLLNLVSLLYSGQLHDNGEEVLSAAESLGIEIPKQPAEGQYGGKGTTKEWVGAEQVPDPQGEMVRGRRKQDTCMSTGCRDRLRECGSQTEHRSEMKERETQTEYSCSDPLQSSQTVCLIGQTTCSTNQGHCVYANVSDVPLMQPRVYSAPEKRPYTCDVLHVAPPAESYQTVSNPACVTQISFYPSEPSYPQAPISATLQAPPSHYTCLEMRAIQSDGSGVSVCGDDMVNGYEQFDGNIPGFISHFLDPACSQNVERRKSGRTRSRRGVGAENSMRRARTRSRTRGGGTARGGLARVGRRQNFMDRAGRVAMLVCRGRGGGKVGRKQDIGAKGKDPVRRQGTQVGERRGIGSWRQTSRREGSERQDEPLLIKRPRGRPRLRPLPSPSISRASCAMVPANQNITDSPVPSLLHTLPLPPVPNSTQPMDWLLDEIMTGFHFLPPVPAENQTIQHGFMNTGIPNVPPCMHSCGKPMDAKTSQHQPEGELNDILDNFLRTFEQQVNGSGLDLEEESSKDQHYTDIRKSSGVLVSGNSHNTPNAFTPCTQLQPQRAKPQGLNLETQLKTHRLTRSQTIKRKIDPALNSLPVPAMRKRRRQSRKQSRSPTSGTHRKGRGVGRPCGRGKRIGHRVVVCTSDGKVNEGNGAQISSVRTLNNDVIQQLGEERPGKMSAPVKRRVEDQCRRRSSRRTDPSVLLIEHSEETATEVASSAFEKMRMFLESKRKQEEEHRMVEGSERMHKEKERLEHGTVVRHRVTRAEQRGTMEAKGEGRFTEPEEHRGAKWKGERRGDMGRNQRRSPGHGAPSQMHVPSDADFVTSAHEETVRINSDNCSMFSTTDLSLGSRWGDPLSGQHSHKDLPPSYKGIMLNMADLTLDSGEKTPALSGEEQRLSHTLLYHKLLPLQTPMMGSLQSMGSSSEEDVDVLEVSSSASDPVTMPTAMWEPEPEEEVEDDDVEIDVLCVDSD